MQSHVLMWCRCVTGVDQLSYIYGISSFAFPIANEADSVRHTLPHKGTAQRHLRTHKGTCVHTCKITFHTCINL
jgi:hypothetical protein